MDIYNLLMYTVYISILVESRQLGKYDRSSCESCPSLGLSILKTMI